MNSKGFSIDLCRCSFASILSGQEIKTTELSSIRYKLEAFSAVAYKDLAFLVTGGKKNYRLNKSVMRYTIKNDKWDIQLP